MNLVDMQRKAESSSRRGSRKILTGFLPSAFYVLVFALCAIQTAFAADGQWTKQQSGTFAYLRALFFLDRNLGWAAGGNGALLKTTDGGRSWKRLPYPTKDTLHDIYFHDAANGWLVCETNIYMLATEDEPRSYLLKTSDGGETWRRIEATGADNNTALLRIIFSDRNHGCTFGEEGALYATTDGGESWTRRFLPTGNVLLGGSFLDNQQRWLVGGGWTILQTSDGGSTWRKNRMEKPTNSAASGAHLHAVAFVDSKRGWAVGSNGMMVRTTDGGESWHEIQTPTDSDLNDVKFVNELEGWAVGSGGTIIHTTNGGTTWKVERANTTHPLERLFLIDNANAWAVGFGGTIIRYNHDSYLAKPMMK